MNTRLLIVVVVLLAVASVLGYTPWCPITDY
jgi:hypothetical protein